jgi:hypothetical protein
MQIIYLNEHEQKDLLKELPDLKPSEDVNSVSGEIGRFGPLIFCKPR